MLWTQEQKSHTHRLSLAGGGGELFRGHAWRQELFGVGRGTRVNHERLIRVTLVDGTAAALLAGGLAGEVAEYLRALMIAQTGPYASAPNTTQWDVLLARRKPVWDGIYGSAAGAFLQTALPFLFKPAFTLGFSLEPRYRSQGRLLRAMIERLDQRVAALPTTAGGPALPRRPATIHRFAPYYARLGRIGIYKMSQRALGHGLLAPAGTQDPRVAAGQRAVLGHMDLTPATMRSGALYEGSALAAFLTRAHAPDFGQQDLLGRIITAELAWRAGEAD